MSRDPYRKKGCFLPLAKLAIGMVGQQKRKGLSETLIVHCLNGSAFVQAEKVNWMKGINLCSVAVITSMRGRLTTKLHWLCNELIGCNVLQPINKKSYNNYLSYLKPCAVESERSLRAVAHELPKLKLESEDYVGQALGVAVSTDAAWQKIWVY